MSNGLRRSLLIGTHWAEALIIFIPNTGSNVFPKRSVLFLSHDRDKIHEAQVFKTTRVSRILYGKFFEMLLTGDLIKSYHNFSAHCSLSGVFFVQKILQFFGFSTVLVWLLLYPDIRPLLLPSWNKNCEPKCPFMNNNQYGTKFYIHNATSIKPTASDFQ
jgi:hypothetical protein